MKYAMASILVTTLTGFTWVQMDQPVLLFSQGKQPKGTPAEWVFKNEADEGSATMTVDAQGFSTGNGVATIQVRAQSEYHTPTGTVGSDSLGGLRMKPLSPDGDPVDQNVVEVFAVRTVRVRPFGDGSFDVMTGNKTRMRVDAKGRVFIAGLPAHQPLCVDEQGLLGAC